MNSAGRVLVVFLVIIAILLISMTAVSIFFFQKEIEQRKNTETALEISKKDGAKLTIELEDLKKQKFLLEDKNKEADDKINSLLDELELEGGLREEIKKENLVLKEKIDKEVKEKTEINKKLELVTKEAESKLAELTEITKSSQARIVNLEESLQGARQQNKELNDQIAKLNKEIQEQKVDLPLAGTELDVLPAPVTVPPKTENLALEKIVVAPGTTLPEGRVLSVDSEIEFIIINLGSKDGMAVGTKMSVYRGKDYLGDIKITRVQPDMSAADLIAPFTISLIRKNDQVVAVK